MFLFSYFQTASEALHLALCDDGFSWQPLRGGRPLLESTVGSRSIRDPFIIRQPDGRFHLLATDGWASASILHATSDDLAAWSPLELLPVMGAVPGCRNCWAPEAFHDSLTGLYHLVWSSDTRAGGPGAPAEDHRIWTAATVDFCAFTEPSLFYDPGHSVIDASVAWTGADYVMAVKDERGRNERGTDHKAIRICRSPDGRRWSCAAEYVTPALTEGPALYPLAGGWVLIFDHFLDARYGALLTSDWVHWSDAGTRMRIPAGARHGSVLEIPEDIGRKLLARLP